MDKSSGVSANQTVVLASFESASNDPENCAGSLPRPRNRQATEVPHQQLHLARARHRADLQTALAGELCFKWIKQHLRIKAFYGTSENAVKTQIWIAVSVYVLVAIVRKRLRLDSSLHQILQILSVIPFEKTPVLQALQTYNTQPDLDEISNQLILQLIAGQQ